MKKLFENWRKFVKEAEANTKDSVFTEQELQALNKSIRKIIDAAKNTLGADHEGAEPMNYITAKQLEPFEFETDMQKVAEEADVIPMGDVEKLRKQYYGDEDEEGELKKRGPKSVKDAPKGLGKMNVQDFEQSGFVMKVPEDVLEDFRDMVEETKRAGDLYSQSRDWYHDIRKLLDDETENDRDSALLGLLIATYSPRAKFALNLTEAVFMFKALEKDAKSNPELLKKYLETFPGAEKHEPGAPRGFTNASKVPNFALNLIAPELAGQRNEQGDVVYNDTYTWNSTIDTWMIDAFYPHLKRASTSKEWETVKGKLMSNVVSYRYMAQLVAQEAKKLNLLPHELQAIIWVSMQVRQTGDASLGVTTQFATNQIKEAIANIRAINEEMEEAAKSTQESESWLKTILSAIDEKGFAEAAKIVLGDKEAKAKGVRSITSMGKKGSAYKYYEPPAPPEGEEDPKPKKKKAKGPKAPPKEKPAKAYEDPAYADLDAFYVMNDVIQMPTGKFNNLYDSVTLYLDPEFSTQKAVEYITGRFDPEARATKDYFKEGVNEWGVLPSTIIEAEYQGRKVTLNKPFRTPNGPKKFSVYVNNEKGNVVKVNFGSREMEIKRDDPKRRKSFRARHNCDDPGPKWKARYWSCYQWRSGAKVEG